MYASDLEKWYAITRLSDTDVAIKLPGKASATTTIDLKQISLYPEADEYKLGKASVYYSTSHYKFVPETMHENNAACSRYFTKKVKLDKPSTAVRLMFCACCTASAEFEIWIKTQNEYDTEQFDNVNWWRITDEAFNKKISKDAEDFKDYECTLEFTDNDGNEDFDSFNSIAIKIVMKSTNQVEVPKFKNLRVICLGT